MYEANADTDAANLLYFLLLKWRRNWEKREKNRFISHEVSIFFSNTHKNEIVWCFNFENAKCHTYANLIIPTLISLDMRIKIYVFEFGEKLFEWNGFVGWD